MAAIQVTPELMRNTAKNVDIKIDDWRSAVTKIYTLAGEMDGMWDGLGNESFNQAFSEDKPKFDSLNILMTDYSKAIVTAAELYDEGEKQVKDIVKRRG